MTTVTKRRTIHLLTALFVLAFVGKAMAAASWVNPDLLVDAATVKAKIDSPDWVVVDARDLKDYVKGHIPGAISFGKRVKKAFRDPSSRVFNDLAKYESLLGKAGIGNDTHVVFYHGDLKTLHDATVGFWVMEYLGHDKVHVLDGGLDAWRKAGNRLDMKPTIKPPKTFTVKVRPQTYASTAEVLEIATGQGNGRQLIDARTKKEYLGEDIRTIMGGHVPNATRNVSDLDTLKKVKDPKTGKDKQIAYLDYGAAVKSLGDLDKNRRTIAYCQTGTRSTLIYLEMRLLGFKEPANWDESWRVWGSDMHAYYPIDAPNGRQFYNFDKVNKKLKELEKKLTALTAKVAPAPK